MTKIGDKKTIYSYAEDRIVEHKSVCVGFMPSKTPVWYFGLINSVSFERKSLFIAFNTIGSNIGYHETVEEVLEHMKNLADIRDVMNDFLRANVESAREKWEEKENDGL